jgi:hypothetical protein
VVELTNGCVRRGRRCKLFIPKNTNAIESLAQ